MSMAGDAAAVAAKPPMQARTSPARRALRHVFNTLGYSLARKDQDRFDCPSLPLPSADIVARAAGYFANTFPISPKSGLSAARGRPLVWLSSRPTVTGGRSAGRTPGR